MLILHFLHFVHTAYASKKNNNIYICIFSSSKFLSLELAEEVYYESKHCDEAPNTLFYLQNSTLTVTPTDKTDTYFYDNV